MKTLKENKNATNKFSNLKIDEFLESLTRINFNYEDSIKIMISEGEDAARDVKVLNKCLTTDVIKQNGEKK